MREYADRAMLGEKELGRRVMLQVKARLAPYRIRIPEGFRPWTMFDRHMAALLEAGKCDAGRRR